MSWLLLIIPAAVVIGVVVTIATELAEHRDRAR